MTLRPRKKPLPPPAYNSNDDDEDVFDVASSSFDDSTRHYSSIIGRVIEKQLTELQIFDKDTTITCDGVPNMVGLVDYFSRTGINRIQCMVHTIHLIICNGLGIWLKKVTVIQESDTNMIDIDVHLSQTDIEECNQGDSELESATADRSTSDQQSDEDESEDEESDLEDNFQYGVNTDDDNNILPIEIDQRFHSYFDPRGLSTLKASEIASIEHELKQIITDNNIQKVNTSHETSSSSTTLGCGCRCA
ncbi:unnamed protein product [Rotaria sordida]|uniref:Uncharacterized protein n=1 Tax=Rotaria sordida TaxID=392033 RepID=A0A814IQW1_9BILA|nr:unnamed protein product [Rotaria sordida]